MKKLFFLACVLFSISAKAQFQFPSSMSFKIEIDSIDENKVFIKQFKIVNLADTTLQFMRITAKVNGKFNANADSSQFNFNVTFEGQLDSAKGIKNLERRLAKEKEDEIRQEEARLLRLYKKNKDVDPKLKEKAAGAKLGVMAIPKSYETAVVKKKKWYQRNK